jgi:predicted nuclease of predicted toxin-antitoxin system
LGYDSIHTIDLPQKDHTKDKQIIELAEKEARVIITKDNDFLESYMLYRKPPKLILIKTGNIKNSLLLELFEKNHIYIVDMIKDNSLMEINTKEIIIHE